MRRIRLGAVEVGARMSFFFGFAETSVAIVAADTK